VWCEGGNPRCLRLNLAQRDVHSTFSSLTQIYGPPSAQKEAYNSESIYAGVKNYLAESSFRDPASHEYKTWLDIVTVDDFWNWHDLLLIPRVLGEEKVQAGGTVQGSSNQMSRLLQHNVLVVPLRMTFVRAKYRPCDLEERCVVPAKVLTTLA
jgi:hypothetical protein